MTPAEIASRLPAPPELERLSLAIAALDAIMSPEWADRYFSFDPRWDPTQRMASLRNGSGDNYFIVFDPAGTVVRVFDHESELSPWTTPDGGIAPGILDGFPGALQGIIDEPAFRTAGRPSTDLTFAAWRLRGATSWSSGSVDDDGGATQLLAVVLDGTPHAYRSYAADYFGDDPGDDVNSFYGMKPADVESVRRLNPDADATAVLSELAAMGYPIRRV
jgi:hypothetical protein